MRRVLFTALSCFAALTVPAQVIPSQSAAGVRLRTAESNIPHIELTVGAEGLGGATIEDAVVVLRRLTDFPICIELLEYDKAVDGLTLGSALAQLRALKAKQGLAFADEARLQRYEQLAATEDPATLVGFKKKTFTLVQDNITVRALLDRVTELDSNYLWRNDGTSNAPIIVIQPRKKSALDWSVPPICGTAQELSSTSLYGLGGKLSVLFQAHTISRVEINRGNKLPDVQLELCRDNLTARDILNLTIKAYGHGLSWSLSGTKGLRWLTFQ